MATKIKAEKERDAEGARKWILALDLAKKSDEKWRNRGKNIVDRYRDDRPENTTSVKYNILWSNIETLAPAIYARTPKANVARRNADKEPVSRTACQLLERALQFELEFYNDFDSAMKNVVIDRLLPGRGVAWVRFEPHLEMQPVEANKGEQVSDDTQAPGLGNGYECCPVDYVYWEDFRCSPARTWEEVTWVARRVYLDREEGVARFGKEFKNAPLSHMPIGMEEYKGTDMQAQADAMKKAKVWEIWDKSSAKVYWVAEGCQSILDTKEDPLGLDGFFPCPKPLMSTTTTDTLVPVADYVLYQDQAKELDKVTERISLLVEACKVVGVYAASAKEIERMFTEGVDNTLIPCDNWAMFAEKGGLKGMVDWLPLDMVVGALQQLYLAREQIKQVIYEVTGISDILRGASQAQETLGAQQIKAQFGSMRLESRKKEVARFASDIIRIKAQIMCSLYRPETIVQMAGITGQDQQFIPQALQLLVNEPLRNFRIEIAADSMVEIDEITERQGRMEFLNVAGTFLEKAVAGAQAVPELAPLMGEMLMFAVRSWKTAYPIEQAFDDALTKLQQPKPPAPPPPEVVKAQTDVQIAQVNLQTAQIKGQSEGARAQAEAAKAQAEIARAQADMQSSQQEGQREAWMAQMQAMVDERLEAQRQQYEGAMESQRLMFDKWKAELDAAVKIEVANISAETAKETAATKAAEAEVSREVK